jgi:hypothetical protein
MFILLGDDFGVRGNLLNHLVGDWFDKNWKFIFGPKPFQILNANVSMEKFAVCRLEIDFFIVNLQVKLIRTEPGPSIRPLPYTLKYTVE